MLLADHDHQILEGAKNIERIQRVVPVGRLGHAKEVADAVVFLALNNYANNCQLNLDGGLSAVNPLEDFLPSDYGGTIPNELDPFYADET